MRAVLLPLDNTLSSVIHHSSLKTRMAGPLVHIQCKYFICFPFTCRRWRNDFYHVDVKVHEKSWLIRCAGYTGSDVGKKKFPNELDEILNSDHEKSQGVINKKWTCKLSVALFVYVIFHGVCSWLYIINAVSDTQRDQQFSQRHAGLGRVSIFFGFQKNTLVLSHVLMCVFMLQKL